MHVCLQGCLGAIGETKGALTLGQLYRARVCLPPKDLDSLNSVSTPSAKYSSIPSTLLSERCAQATVQMLMSRHVHTHGYATFMYKRQPYLGMAFLNSAWCEYALMVFSLGSLKYQSLAFSGIRWNRLSKNFILRHLFYNERCCTHKIHKHSATS